MKLHLAFHAFMGSWCQVLVLVVSSTPKIALAFDLELISVMPVSLPIGVALPYSGPALSTAAEDVNRRFTESLNLTVTLLYNKTDRTCEEADVTATRLMSEYYNTRVLNRCVAVIISGCGGAVDGPWLAKEWNVLLFSNSMASESVFSPESAPSLVGMAGTIEDLTRAMLELCRLFGWFHVTLLLDYVDTAQFYGFLYDTSKLLMASGSFADFHLDWIQFSLANRLSVDAALRFATEKSRVFLLLSPTRIVIKVLRYLKENGLFVPGDYVFLVLQPTQQSNYGPATLFDNASSQDEDLFRSVLYLTSSAENGDGSKELNHILTRRLRTDYGTILENGTEPLDLYPIRETYNSVEIFATLVQDSRNRSESVSSTNSHLCGGRRLKSLMINRTFTSSGSTVYIDPKGYRHLDLSLYTYQRQAQRMVVAAHYEAFNKHYIWEHTVTIDWLDGRPPPDVPLCGFSGYDGSCKEQGRMVQLFLPIILVVLLSAVVVTICFLVYRKLHPLLSNGWWLLLPTDIDAERAAQFRGLTSAQLVEAGVENDVV